MSYTQIYIHSVLVCDGRRALLRPEIRNELYPYLAALLQAQDAALLAANGIADHVHLLFALPAPRSLSDTMRDLKANSSRWIRRRFSHRGFGWQREYAAFSVCPSKRLDVEQYIATQAEHHQRRDLREEMLALLRAHGMEPDGRDPWLGGR